MRTIFYEFSKNNFPREVLLEALFRFVEEDLGEVAAKNQSSNVR